MTPNPIAGKMIISANFEWFLISSKGSWLSFKNIDKCINKKCLTQDTGHIQSTLRMTFVSFFLD